MARQRAAARLLFALSLCCFARLSSAEFRVEEASLVIVNSSVPAVDIALATFGIPRYGQLVTCDILVFVLRCVEDSQRAC